jgi:hypothetical protein
MPALQLVQVPLPDPLLYFPAGHAVHASPFAPKAPALQVQAASAELDAGEFVLAGQFVHAAEPVVLLYLPVIQALHGLPFRFTLEHVSLQALQQSAHTSSVKQYKLLSIPS